MNIIGINSGYDAAGDQIYSGGVAYICDGKIIMAIAEDRVSRVKDQGGFSNALKKIYEYYGIYQDDIDYFYISFYGHPLIPDNRTIEKHLELLNIQNQPHKLVVMPSHHYSHAVLAHSLSKFEESIIMVADNEGNLLGPKGAKENGVLFNDCERNSYYWAKGNCITLIERDFAEFGDVSFGKMYNKFNEYIGFDSYLCVGKTMGLSSYGKIPKEWENIDLWYLDNKGKLHSNLKETHDSYEDIEYFFRRNGIYLSRELDYMSEEYKNLAHYVQYQLNKWATKKVEYLCNKYEVNNVCISGGVGLNSIMNYEIGQKLNVDLFVPPYCSDPGQALGNAIYGYISQMRLNNNVVIPKLTFDKYIYLGFEYSNEEVENVLCKYKSDDRFKIDKPNDILEVAADLISDNNIIGFYHGRSEYGARALGNRSILASPTSISIRDRVNTLKKRELFRPLAPAVLDKYSKDYFDAKYNILDTMMLRVVPVCEDKKKEIEGVVHIDGTARVQVVTKENNQMFYDLIERVYKKTGVPIVINTSFNAAGNPIVESIQDAIEEFYTMDLDALICEDFLISRR